MDEVFEIRSSIEISVNDIKIYTIYDVLIVNKESQGIHTVGSLYFRRQKWVSYMMYSEMIIKKSLLPAI